MSGRVYTAEEKHDIIMESFQNPDITISPKCREHGRIRSILWKEERVHGPHEFTAH
ncbi:MAG: hypothetical protein AMDU4_FER2C00175G0020 [Ferroplasma sp. Type II]|uniref:hypothetical protein n=1 Tax=Ferroplasma sp. Type II TaxID=261388 RepID=UPI0003896F7E|nr:hypothetical protein [Ferroplasma sp. Type II]EQB71759.1 MAG: hypothetical protein AMDU4_FER2C00175G0020 [Ferroplasma sp. Type II]